MRGSQDVNVDGMKRNVRGKFHDHRPASRPGTHTCPLPASMSSSHRFERSAIKNKQKREQVFRKAKKEKGQAKLQRRLANAKQEADDPKAKQVSMDPLGLWRDGQSDEFHKM